MESADSEFHMTDRIPRDPAYCIALASDADNQLAAAGSVLIDCSNELMNQHRDIIARLRSEPKEITNERAEALEWKSSQVANLEAALASSRQALDWRQSQISRLQESEHWLQDQTRLIGEHLEWERKDASAYIESLEGTIQENNKHTAKVENSPAKANSVVQELANYKTSRAWVVFTKLREINKFFSGSK
jgi:chromosome segregation ATPase